MAVHTLDHRPVIGVLCRNVVVQNGVIPQGLPIHKGVERSERVVLVVGIPLPQIDVAPGDVEMAATTAEALCIAAMVGLDDAGDHPVRDGDHRGHIGEQRVNEQSRHAAEVPAVLGEVFAHTAGEMRQPQEVQHFGVWSQQLVQATVTPQRLQLGAVADPKRLEPAVEGHAKA